jgi:DNA replication licensing factor MCM7
MNNYNSTYKKDAELFVKFLKEFEEDTAQGRVKKYWMQCTEIRRRQRRTIDIALDDLVKWTENESNSSIVQRIQQNALRYLTIFSEVIDTLIPPESTSIDEDDVWDILNAHRTHHTHVEQRTTEASTEPQTAKSSTLPKELLRRYELRLVPLSSTKAIPIRQVRAQHIGQLVTVTGVVTRCSEVKPLLLWATYTCDVCGWESYQRIAHRTFMPLTVCPVCTGQKKCGSLLLQTRGSKFVKFQDVRIQEPAEHVPVGHVPRTMTVHITGELTRLCAPGDTVTIHGIFLPVPHEARQALKTSLVADTYLLAQGVIQHKQKYSQFVLSDTLKQRIEEFRSKGRIYERLAHSIAPEICGLEDVKKALLLQLVGGSTRILATDGMKIRGEINVCLMGDPGVAKSQLLKHIATLAPRGVYTSGKGSSGVGLTAAILKDNVTGEMTLEGGSLVLADMGICCIDEFDKMDDADRTAIYEVMEQQSISIAKAGITTSLNARTAILAAANPAYGRYNAAKSPTDNINLPAALLSRFDLLFLLLDKPDPMRDRELAEHVTYVHRYAQHPASSEFDVLPPDVIRGVVAIAKTFTPTIPPTLSDFIVTSYVNMRNRVTTNPPLGWSGGGEGEFTYTTPRTLLGILRLSQALARLRFENVVQQSDIEEAIRLMYVSKASLFEQRSRYQAGGFTTARPLDYKSRIFNLIKEMARAKGTLELNYTDIVQKVVRGEHSEEQLQRTLQDYERLNLLTQRDTTMGRIITLTPEGGVLR